MKSGSSQRKWLMIGAGLLVLVGGVWLWRSQSNPPVMLPAPVVVLEVSEAQLSNVVEALGTAMANESVNLTASASETIAEILFADGQEVKQGEVLARLEQSEEKARLEGARAQLREHQREASRLGGLLKNKAASRRDYDERSTQAEVTRRSIEAIEAQIKDRTITAPFDGVLGVRRVSVGALVQPGDVITTIDDIHPIKLDFEVPSIYISKLKPGIPILATSDALEDTTFMGKVDTVDSRIDAATRSILVRALIDNEQGQIKPGLLMQVKLLENQRMALVVPEEAVIQRKDKHVVFVVDDQNQAKQREVKIGVREPGQVEILGGLSVGEAVVVRGMGEIAKDQKVNVQQRWKSMQDSQFEHKAKPAEKAK